MARAEPPTFTIEAGKDGRAVRLTWRPEALAPAAGPTGAERVPSPWVVEGEIDWDQVQALRLISAVFEDGRELAVAAVRPLGAAGHDRESLVSHLLTEGEPVTVDEVLLSTEYDAEGLPRRVGLELWVEPEGPPLRVAADREGEVETGGEAIRREATRMGFRLGGAAGDGLYEVLRPA